MYDAALLVENGTHEMLAALVVVSAPRTLQIHRVMARDGLSEADAEARIDAQLPLAEKVAAADYVIENDGDLALLQTRTLALHALLNERFGAKS
jgi:dephospho-CoA kinase